MKVLERAKAAQMISSYENIWLHEILLAHEIMTYFRETFFHASFNPDNAQPDYNCLNICGMLWSTSDSKQEYEICTLDYLGMAFINASLTQRNVNCLTVKKGFILN